MARRRDLAEQGVPAWVAAPLATDYLTEAQIRADWAWPIRALALHNERLRAWAADRKTDWMAHRAGYPRLPRDRDWSGVGDLEQALAPASHDDRTTNR